MEVDGILGNPVEHSKSPPLHEAAYEALGLDATYVTFEVDPTEFEIAFRGARALGVRGLSVTSPFKEKLFDLVTLDPMADRIGAVNTVHFTPEGPVGYNTDAAGVVRSFEYHDIPLSGTATIVGAGGAGKAAAFGLAEAGMSVHIANRTVDRAHAIADSLSDASGHGLDALPEVIPDSDIVVNMTSVGLKADESPVPADLFDEEHAVLDAVYQPRKTRFLRDAKQAGATIIEGTWMLLFQGVEAFEIWTGQDAPVEVMSDALHRRL